MRSIIITVLLFAAQILSKPLKDLSDDSSIFDDDYAIEEYIIPRKQKTVHIKIVDVVEDRQLKLVNNKKRGPAYDDVYEKNVYEVEMDEDGVRNETHSEGSVKKIDGGMSRFVEVNKVVKLLTLVAELSTTFDETSITNITKEIYSWNLSDFKHIFFTLINSEEFQRLFPALAAKMVQWIKSLF